MSEEPTIALLNLDHDFIRDAHAPTLSSLTYENLNELVIDHPSDAYPHQRYHSGEDLEALLQDMQSAISDVPHEEQTYDWFAENETLALQQNDIGSLESSQHSPLENESPVSTAEFQDFQIIPHVPCPSTMPPGFNRPRILPGPFTPFSPEFTATLTAHELADLLLNIELSLTQRPSQGPALTFGDPDLHLPFDPILPFVPNDQLSPADSQASSVTTDHNVLTPTVVVNLPTTNASDPQRKKRKRAAADDTDFGVLCKDVLECSWAQCTERLTREICLSDQDFQTKVHVHLKSHRSTFTRGPNGKWRCQWKKCTKEFSDKRGLERHFLSNSHEINPISIKFHCSQCNGSWTRRSDRDGHIRKDHHPGNVENVFNAGGSACGAMMVADPDGERPAKKRKM
ncbi:hypothetical protein C0992_002710 [Termitomyces sp. T32_za158]|nr:hypothetical protein C0992_002710 [Termitomyces sp. T32_za158]